jgi:hypothetical protein
LKAEETLPRLNGLPDNSQNEPVVIISFEATSIEIFLEDWTIFLLQFHPVSSEFYFKLKHCLSVASSKRSSRTRRAVINSRGRFLFLAQ